MTQGYLRAFGSCPHVVRYGFKAVLVCYSFFDQTLLQTRCFRCHEWFAVG